MQIFPKAFSGCLIFLPTLRGVVGGRLLLFLRSYLQKFQVIPFFSRARYLPSPFWAWRPFPLFPPYSDRPPLPAITALREVCCLSLPRRASECFRVDVPNNLSFFPCSSAFLFYFRLLRRSSRVHLSGACLRDFLEVES